MRLMHVYIGHLNTITVVVLQVVFRYEILYMKWAHQCYNSRLKSLSPVSRPLSSPGGGRGVIGVFYT